jgi:purine-cytosine permease-like protein
LPKVRIGRFSLELPRNRFVRVSLGLALVIVGALFGFLPILGYWMVPLGLLVLASDSAVIRRLNRRAGVAIVGWWKGRKTRLRRDPA